MAPRALGDSVRPRRLAGVLGRPLNFTVRRRSIQRMGTKERRWNLKHSEDLRASMTKAELASLFRRSKSDPDSLSMDEVGVLFLVTRDRIRVIEELLNDGKKPHRH